MWLFRTGQFYDQHYRHVPAGSASDHQPSGGINELLSTPWYHDHRLDFTAQSTYKGCGNEPRCLRAMFQGQAKPQFMAESIQWVDWPKAAPTAG